MAEKTSISWCDSTFNPWLGCTKISPACDHCYAEALMDKRMARVRWGAGQPRTRTTAQYWRQPITWNRDPFYECANCGWRGDAQPLHPAECKPDYRQARRRVFCASLADVFDNEVEPGWRADLFALIRATPNLDWLLLTKRIGNATSMITDAVSSLPRDAACGTGQFNHTPIAQWPWPNVWLGATICNQAEADRDIIKLLRVPARVRFLSIEPMLGAVDLTRINLGESACEAIAPEWDGVKRVRIILDALTGAPKTGIPPVNWVIAGGESGPHARPAHPDWIRSLRDQCVAAGVPFLFKQWGEHSLEYDRDRDDPDYRRCSDWNRKPGRWINLAGGHGFHGDRVHYAHRVGKKAAGRLLDGREHNGFPTTREPA